MVGFHCQVLELLWDLSHLPTLSRQLIELALEEHLAILSDSFSVREQVKRNYVIKCVDDIRKVRVCMGENNICPEFLNMEVFLLLLCLHMCDYIYQYILLFLINRVLVYYHL